MVDRERYERLYRAHAEAVSAFACRRVRADEAEDVVAEVFLAAWRRIDEAPADSLPWLLGIARGVLVNGRRGRRRGAALTGRLASELLAGAAAQPVELDMDALRALDALSDADRELLLLIAWEGLSREQTARVLGVSTGALAVRFHRARRRFERALVQHRPAGHPDRDPPMPVKDPR